MTSVQYSIQVPSPDNDTLYMMTLNQADLFRLFESPHLFLNNHGHKLANHFVIAVTVSSGTATQQVRKKHLADTARPYTLSGIDGTGLLEITAPNPSSRRTLMRAMRLKSPDIQACRIRTNSHEHIAAHGEIGLSRSAVASFLINAVTAPEELFADLRKNGNYVEGGGVPGKLPPIKISVPYTVVFEGTSDLMIESCFCWRAIQLPEGGTQLVYGICAKAY